MKTFKVIALTLFAALSFAACDNDDPADEPIIDPVYYENVVILNNGNWGSNDANMLSYNLTSGESTPDLFFTVNNQKLGDLGQDIVEATNGDCYIAVNGSQIIYVTDKTMKVKAKIVAEVDGTKLSPRSFCASNDKVYVTYYEGYLGEIDTQTHRVRTASVGMNPEGVTIAGGMLYVANSGGMNYENGYDNTISVVDLKTFREEKRITVNTNPQSVVASADGKTIYVNSFGNYGDIPAKLQSISVATGEVSDLEYTDVKSICAGEGDTLYVVTGGYDENWNISGSVNVYDMKSRTAKGKLFEEAITNYYSISYSKGLVFVGTSDYKTNGDVYIYDGDGKFLVKIDAQGLNPQKAIRL